MKYRITLTFLLLATGLVINLLGVAQQKPVAPGFSPAPSVSRCRQPSKLRFSNTIGAALKDGATTAPSGPAKPFTKEQVVSMVRAGLGDDSGSKLIEHRGIDFAPAEKCPQTFSPKNRAGVILRLF